MKTEINELEAAAQSLDTAATSDEESAGRWRMGVMNYRQISNTCNINAVNPKTRMFLVSKRLSKQSWGWWSETPSSSLWRHRNAFRKKSAKPKESIGRQTIHPLLELGSPGGFMGRIWRPDDRILAALITHLIFFLRPGSDIGFFGRTGGPCNFRSDVAGVFGRGCCVSQRCPGRILWR